MHSEGPRGTLGVASQGGDALAAPVVSLQQRARHVMVAFRMVDGVALHDYNSSRLPSRDAIVAQRRPNIGVVQRRALRAVTLARLLLVPPIIVTFMADAWVSMACLAVFMVADLSDGVIARLLDQDDVNRRAIDSVVDRLAIDACLIGATAKGVLPLPFLIAFLARDAYCSTICVRMVRRVGVVVKADLAYRGLNFSIAVWALLVPFISPSLRVGLAATILLASLLIAADLTRCVRVVLARGPSPGATVLAPRDLRRASKSPRPHAALAATSSLLSGSTAN